MGLPVPEEPRDIKELIKTVRAGMGKDGGIDWDSFSVWVFNRLPKYLWECWENGLRARGVTWQKLLRILKLHTIDMVEWAIYNRLGWAELVKRIEASVENYSKGGSQKV